MKITPLIKGLITAALMIATTLALFYFRVPRNSPAQYIVFVLYAAGILWTQFDYARTHAITGKFGELFGQGFRCFIIIALTMVIFTGIFIYNHPEFAQEEAIAHREYLVNNEKSRTPAEINAEVATAKKTFLQRKISGLSFGYLAAGALFAAGGAGLILMRRK